MGCAVSHRALCVQEHSPVLPFAQEALAGAERPAAPAHWLVRGCRGPASRLCSACLPLLGAARSAGLEASAGQRAVQPHRFSLSPSLAGLQTVASDGGHRVRWHCCGKPPAAGLSPACCSGCRAAGSAVRRCRWTRGSWSSVQPSEPAQRPCSECAERQQAGSRPSTRLPQKARSLRAAQAPTPLAGQPAALVTVGKGGEVQHQ